MEQVRCSQQHGRKRIDRGFTVLEILVAFVLSFVVLSSFFYVRKKINRQWNVRICEEKKWEWNSFFEEIQLRMLRWQMYAPSCLKSGLSPFRTDGDKYVFLNLTSYSVVSTDMVSSAGVYVLPGHQFSKGTAVTFCEAAQSRDFTIENIEIGEKQTLLKLRSNEGESPYLPKQGTTVVNTLETSYELRQETATGKFLYQSIGPNQYKPLLTNLTSAVFEFFPEQQRLDLRITEGTCEHQSSFFIGIQRDHPGRWKLTKDSLELEPWNFPVVTGAVAP